MKRICDGRGGFASESKMVPLINHLNQSAPILNVNLIQRHFHTHTHKIQNNVWSTIWTTYSLAMLTHTLNYYSYTRHMASYSLGSLSLGEVIYQPCGEVHVVRNRVFCHIKELFWEQVLKPQSNSQMTSAAAKSFPTASLESPTETTLLCFSEISESSENMPNKICCFQATKFGGKFSCSHC